MFPKKPKKTAQLPTLTLIGLTLLLRILLFFAIFLLLLDILTPWFEIAIHNDWVGGLLFVPLIIVASGLSLFIVNKIGCFLIFLSETKDGS